MSVPAPDSSAQYQKKTAAEGLACPALASPVGILALYHGVSLRSFSVRPFLQGAFYPKFLSHLLHCADPSGTGKHRANHSFMPDSPQLVGLFIAIFVSSICPLPHIS